jgi:hypothetical protein
MKRSQPAAAPGALVAAVAVAVLWLPAAAEAHTGACSGPDLAGTVALAVGLGVVLFAPWRRRALTTRAIVGRLALPVAVTLAATLTACGGKSATSASRRPTTSARLQIVSPRPNEVTGPDPTLQLNLVGARVVPATQVKGQLRGDEGHIHVLVDGKLVSMAYGTTQDLHSLSPGAHSVQAEFVATDHLPFANRVVAAVLFQVQA